VSRLVGSEMCIRDSPHTDETTIPNFELKNLISKIGYDRVKSML
jgi:hypothetical protein